jgi:hypothetical protein
LRTEYQAPLIRQVFYAELKASNDEAAHSDPQKLASYARGFAAIETLFPASTTGKPRSGDIRMPSSQIATLDGGDVELLAPAGSVVMGVVQATAANAQGAGVLALKTGRILSMSDGDVQVGQSAVHTLGGGDIEMWSNFGNIDAGKGAKTRKNITSATFRTDANARTVLDPGSTATGAGIATLQASIGATPADVRLATPRGFVDAGDAGIRSSHNVIIAATLVLNASNIQAQGTITGLPTIALPSLGSLTAASNAAAASTKAVEQPDAAPARQDTPSIIIVEVLGYGGPGGEGSRPADAGGNADDGQNR